MDPFAAPDAITTGPNNTVWFAQRGFTVSNDIGYLSDEAGAQIHEIPVPLSANSGDPFDIVYDAAGSGSIWFTERYGLTLDEIDPYHPENKYKRFALGVPLMEGSYPRRIAVNPRDGNLWVGIGTDSGSQRLVNVYDHTTGEWQRAIRLTGYDPIGLAFDDNGNLWVAERYAHQLEEIDSSGNTVATIPLGMPLSVTLGPDHNMWAADLSGAIYKIDPAHVDAAVKYPVPGGCSPQRIVSDPSRGVLWFTTFLCGHLGLITTSGDITMFQAPVNHANGITMGPKGDIFYTDVTTAALYQAIPTFP
jgi:streptogramin lyase